MTEAFKYVKTAFWTLTVMLTFYIKNKYAANVTVIVFIFVEIIESS